ncbi:MAG: NAD-dependent epimerase/dehydratase family protein [Bacilli bacterium]
MQVVIGSNAIGMNVLEVCLHKGLPVRIVNNNETIMHPNSEQIDVVNVDYFNKAQIKNALRGAKVVYQCLFPGEGLDQEKYLELTELFISVITEVKVPVVVVDDLNIYGFVNGPLDETLPYKSSTTRGDVSRRAANLYHAAEARKEIEVAFVRTSNMFGPYVNASPIGEKVFGALLSGRTVHFPGDADQTHTFTYIEDLASTMVAVGNRTDAFGQAWLVPNDEALSARQFFERVAKYTKIKPRVSVHGKHYYHLAGFLIKDIKDQMDWYYQFEVPRYVKDDKARRRLSISQTPLDFAIEKTIKWYQEKSN